ncbi:MAG: hypothetical protein Q9182_004880 [Xanthomendoza sp. 2 TL-2023]
MALVAPNRPIQWSPNLASGGAGNCLSRLRAANVALKCSYSPNPITNTATFESIVAKYPQKFALISRQGCLSYVGLNERANQLARHLRSLGVGMNCVVAVALERGIEYIVSMLACWKVGAAYLPLDQSLPANRMQYMIRDSEASCLITVKQVIEMKPVVVSGGPTLCLDSGALIQQLKSLPSHNIPHTLQHDHLAYIIYTSGTTGNPKGVTITHSSLFNLVEDIRLSREIEATDRVLLFSPLCFDASIRDISGAMMLGASLYVPEEEEILPGNLMHTIARQGITNSVITPSVLRTCKYEHLPNLRTIVLAGEAADGLLIRSWGEGRKLINAYGPTEATVCCTKKLYYNGKISPGQPASVIGKPILNTTIHIVNDDGIPVRDGEIGEIWITGPGVSRGGYLNLAQLNTERFETGILHQYRTYKTGDLGRLTQDGEVECLGRKGCLRQIKLNGQRIEPEEVENIIRTDSYVLNAAVLIQGAEKHRSLVAYVVPTLQNSVFDIKVLTSRLNSLMRKHLPSYSVPSTIRFLDSLPLTVNRKLDVKVLEDLSLKNNKPPRRVSEPHLTSYEEKVAAALLQALALPFDREISADTTYGELGGSSLQASLVLRHLNESVGCQIHLGQFYRSNISIRELAKMLSEKQQQQQTIPTPAELLRDTILHHNIVYNVPVPSSRRQQHILLTGSTGFLGSHLLVELLKVRNVKVTCIVRPSEHDFACRRVKTALQRWGLWEDEYISYFSTVCGDVSKPFLGLSADEYLDLAGKVDTIYHSAAAVNFVAPYSELEDANVTGTIEVLRFASTVTQKRLTYISTLSVFFEAGNKLEQGMEVPVGNLENGLITGYAQTKWVSEQLVLEWARLGGHALILRPGRLLGNSRNFRCPSDDFTIRLISSILETGIAPELGAWQIDLTPVDFCARASIQLTLNEETGIRNVINQDTISFDEICRSIGGDVERIPYRDWLQLITTSVHLAPLSSLFHGSVWEGQSTFEALLKMNPFRYSSYETTVVGEVHTVSSTKALLEEYLKAIGPVSCTRPGIR